jgi:hypothetical protein
MGKVKPNCGVRLGSNKKEGVVEYRTQRTCLLFEVELNNIMQSSVASSWQGRMDPGSTLQLVKFRIRSG